MATYSVHLFCDSCGEPHPLGIAIGGDFGGDPQRLNDPAAGIRVPADRITMRDNSTRCPKTGAIIYQKDHETLFLVRVKN